MPSEEEQQIAQEIDYEANIEGFLKHLQTSGRVVKTQGEIEASINSAKSQVHSEWEKQLGEAIGEQKPAGVRGLDWAKQAIAKKEPVNTEQSLEPAQPKVSDEVNDAVIKSLKTTIDKMEKDRENEKERLKTLSIRGIIRNMPFDGDEAEQKESKSLIEDHLTKNYTWKEDEDGNLIAYSGTEPIIDTETNQPIEISKLISTKFKRFLATPGTNQLVNGTGTHRNQLQKSTDPDVIIVSSMDALRSELGQLGLTLGSEGYNKKFRASVAFNKLQ